MPYIPGNIQWPNCVKFEFDVPTEDVIAGFKAKAKSFYEQGSRLGWSDGLYEKVKAAMGATN